MKIYQKIKRFNPNTGEPIEKWAYKETRCDYTGVVIEDSDYCAYNLNYNGHDPCFGASGEEYEFGKKYNVSMHEFLSEEYDFISDFSGEVYDGETEVHAEMEMMQEALAKCNDEKSEWYRCYTFESMCRVARITSAKLLIEEGEITPDQLNPDF